jgi:hypothetical protein
MKSINPEDFSKSLNYLFKETFEGSPKEGSVYLDKGVGVFNTIGNLSAEDASKSIAGANIAAHSEHIRYYLEVLNNFLKGTVQVADWSKSWNIKEVTDEEWEEIRENLAKQFREVAENFEKFAEWNNDAITEATAIVVHSAYHLGAIRQIAKSFEN